MAQPRELFYVRKDEKILSMLQVILLHTFMTCNNIFICFICLFVLFVLFYLFYFICLAYEVQKYKCMYNKAYKHLFSLSQNVFYPNQTFVRLDFSLFSVRGFDNVLKRALLNFLIFRVMLHYL